MNKTAIKNFAIWARVQLIEAAKQKAYEYEITETGENKSGLDMVGGRLLTKTEKEQRNQLFSEINRKGFSQVMEEAAYTWFNRFIALRFMEVNGYLPSKVRVFTDENGAFRPEILKQAVSVDLEGLDRDKVLDLLDRQDNEALYKYLLITQCNALNAGLPYMFEKIGGWTELLFPANLLRQDSVLGQMISEIPEDDWTDAVQIIGWLYQYYNSELKDETFALLKKNVKITKERIPAATQLFTPDWIVRYMVENSLGRLWYEGHPDFDKSQWRYYLDETEQEPEVETQLKKIRAEYAQIKPEDIKVIDPCMGSGHILVYAFDVLMQIYTSAGWSERDAAKSILENNLYGLDIDDRAGQLAYFAVMMKARKHSRRILNGEVKPNVLSIQDSNWMTDEFIAYVAEKDANMKADLVMLRKTFRDAKEFGSLICVPVMKYSAIYERIDIIRRSHAEDLFQTQYRVMAIEQLLPLVKQFQIMSQKYDVVVTNPPYMGNGGMSSKVAAFVTENYSIGKADLFAAFMLKCSSFTKESGFVGMMTSYTWMFLSGYQALREELLYSHSLSSLVQPEYHSFFEEAYVPICTFVFCNKQVNHKKSVCVRLERFTGASNQGVKYLEAVTNENCDYKYVFDTSKLHVIPGSPLVYWASDAVFTNYSSCPLIQDICPPRPGLSTGENERFLRIWYEVKDTAISFIGLCERKWYPINKGGEFRRWYGNHQYIVNWENDGYEIRNFKDSKGKLRSRPQNLQYNFRKAISWSLITTGAFNVRYYPSYYMQNAAGICCYPSDDYICYFLGFLNSKAAQTYATMISPTINTNAGDIARIPIVIDDKSKDLIEDLVNENIHLSTCDWDSFETSWDFKKHPLI